MEKRKRYQRKGVSDRLMYLASNAQLRYWEARKDEVMNDIRKNGQTIAQRQSDLEPIWNALDRIIAIQKKIEGLQYRKRADSNEMDYRRRVAEETMKRIISNMTPRERIDFDRKVMAHIMRDYKGGV